MAAAIEEPMASILSTNSVGISGKRQERVRLRRRELSIARLGQIDRRPEAKVVRGRAPSSVLLTGNGTVCVSETRFLGETGFLRVQTVPLLPYYQHIFHAP